MSDPRDKRRLPLGPRPGGVALPLPAPARDDGATQVGTRVRMSQQLPATTNRDLPILPPENLPPSALELDLDESGEDRTVVDPQMDFELTARSPRIEFADVFDDLGDDLDDDLGGAATPEPSARFPLPPPAGDTAVGRMTLPGTKRGTRRAAGKGRRTPRRPPPGVAPYPPPLEGDDQSTAISTDPLAPLEGPLIGGRYRVVARIGEGGMGKVFKVTHAQLGKTFALKIISDTFAGEAKARDLFYREARLASSLSHPNIASVVDFGEDDKSGAFMVMEFLDGEPLAKVLRRENRISARVACDLMLQVAEALHYIHENKIVHCDIKTENILICELPGTKRRAKQVKLLDFGLARRTTAARNTGSLSGTPHYVAPERIRGEDPAPPSDIYGLGVLFYELLTGKVPWDGNVAQILCGHLELEPVPPSQLIDGGLDPALEKLILRALAKTPAARHRDMDAFIYELRTVMDMLGFGRRKRGSGRKIVIERGTNERDQLVRSLFDGSRLPMAMINNTGMIVVANPAFAKFVMGVAVDVEGLQVQATPLANAWMQFETDLARACAGHPVRRIVEVEVESSDIRRLMIWLDAGASDDHVFFGVHPLDT
ncbi:MAG TPA: serine/threonine-protein kinase [Kofleriaceae bacterium]|nr:serine/threonine-protein kinase [Kofleriaceae bacterium]